LSSVSGGRQWQDMGNIAELHSFKKLITRPGKSGLCYL